MEFNNQSNGKAMHPPLKFEQKCQAAEAERGQKLFSRRLSCPSFRPEHQDKPYMSPAVPFLLPIWAAPERLAACSNKAGCSFACIRLKAPLQSRGPAKWAPAPRPLQPTDSLQLVCNCCVNMYFLSLMILASSRGSTQKGTEQWDVIVLKCAQQKAFLGQLSDPSQPPPGFRAWLDEWSSAVVYSLSPTKYCSCCQPSPLQLLKKNKGVEKRKEKRQPQNIHCITI